MNQSLSGGVNEGKKLRVLVIAEAANPDWTSVPLVGWSLTKALSEVCDVHLVTQVRNKEAIQSFGWREGIDFTCIDSEGFHRPAYHFSSLLRGGSGLAWTIDTAISSIVYPFFELKVWSKFKSRLISGEFDLVHRVTPLSPTAPSPIAKRLKKVGVPYVIGPLNGGVDWPSEFRAEMHKEKEWLSYVRQFHKLLPGYRSTRKHSSALICGSRATMEQMSVTDDKLFFIPENAVDEDRFNTNIEIRQASNPLRAIFIGRLVPYKGLDIALRSMQEYLRNGQIHFDICGDGPEYQVIEDLIKELGVEENVVLHGFVAHREIQNILKESDILVFPSIREFGGGVVLEAMAVGVVPVVSDYAGPSELVNDKIGFRVPISEREILTEGFRQTIGKILEDTSVLFDMKKAGNQQVVDHYTWKRKVKKITAIYDWVISGGEKPDVEHD